MELVKQMEQTQRRANDFAIQESNLRDQIAPLQARLDETVKAKHQLIGQLNVLNALANEQAAAEQQQRPGGGQSEGEKLAAKLKLSK